MIRVGRVIILIAISLFAGLFLERVVHAFVEDVTNYRTLISGIEKYTPFVFLMRQNTSS